MNKKSSPKQFPPLVVSGNQLTPDRTVGQKGSELKPPKMKDSVSKENTVELDGDIVSNSRALMKCFGSNDSNVILRRMDEVARTLPQGEKKSDAYNITLGALYEIAPKDQIEGMLAAQMVATHNLAMQYLASSLHQSSADFFNARINAASKLLRTYTAQVEALQRYRGKGQQKIIVKHVNVSDGGQAIVGNFTQPMKDRGREG